MDTKFSSAIHMLILISEAQTPMSSEQIAVSVGTNASYIRKLAGLLKNAGIIDSRQGRSGFVLTAAPEELTLWRVYCAVEETEQIHLFDIHRNPNDACIVGRHIQPTLSAMFSGIEATAKREMNAKTLRDCMNDMKKIINQTEVEPMRQIDMEGLGHFVHANGNESLDIVVRITLTEDIDTACMQTALEKAAMRYPNFHSVLASDGKGLVYEFSDEKPVLLIGDERRRYGSSALHGFPYCVSCEGKILKLSVHHGITDGYGVTEFVKTLLYYYLEACGKPVSADEHIRLLETAYDEAAEDAMSYLDNYDPSIQFEQPQMGEVKLFALPVAYWDEAGRYEFRRFKLSMSAKQAADYARRCGSSVTGLINAIVCKAFQTAYDLEGKLLINSVTSNFRRLMPSVSMHNFSGWLLTFYTPEMQGLPLAQTAAVMKGMIAQNNTTENALKIISQRSAVGLKQREMPFDEIFADKPDCMIEKKGVRQSLGSLITNVGPLEITESMKPWVRDMELYIPAITSPIVFGVNSVGDALTVSVVQSFEDDDIARAFCKVCGENGLDVTCTDMGIEQFDVLERDAVKMILS